MEVGLNMMSTQIFSKVTRRTIVTIVSIPTLAEWLEVYPEVLRFEAARLREA